ncbi:hypothetical protein COOONC_14998 [Cooperia oncophora]
MGKEAGSQKSRVPMWRKAWTYTSTISKNTGVMFNKNTTKVLEELPKVYPKVYEILSNLDYTYQDMYNKIRDLHIDKATYYSLHAVVFMVVHTVGSHGPYLADTEMFLERTGIATPEMRTFYDLPVV